jgi:hypothetical protein
MKVHRFIPGQRQSALDSSVQSTANLNYILSQLNLSTVECFVDEDFRTPCA